MIAVLLILGCKFILFILLVDFIYFLFNINLRQPRNVIIILYLFLQHNKKTNANKSSKLRNEN